MSSLKYFFINKITFLKILFLSLLTCSLPLYAIEAELKDEKIAYCNRWADRFLSIKDGQNYKKNKISARKFPMYVEICKDHYKGLRNYYKN